MGEKKRKSKRKRDCLFILKSVFFIYKREKGSM